jgi:hypothetical protein
MSEDPGMRRRVRGLLQSVEPPPVPMDEITRRAGTIRLRRAVGGIGLAGLVAAVAVLVPGAATRTAPAQPTAPRMVQMTVSSADGAGPGGVFARGMADGRQWRLAVQNVADAGSACQPAVVLNGQNADPLFPDPSMLTPAGNPSFVTGTEPVPGAAYGFLRVPAAVTQLVVHVGAEPPMSLRPVTVTACGEHFRLAGFAVGVSGPVRIAAYSAAGAAAPYTVPSSLIWPQLLIDTSQKAGAWQNLDVSRGFGSWHVIAHRGPGSFPWRIRTALGAFGECYTLSGVQPGPASDTTVCGPMGAPGAAQSIVSLPSNDLYGVGITGYAFSVSPGTARVVAGLSRGHSLQLTPAAANGRRYVAFAVINATVTWLTWYDAAGRVLASTTALPRYGWIQVKA